MRGLATRPLQEVLLPHNTHTKQTNHMNPTNRNPLRIFNNNFLTAETFFVFFLRHNQTIVFEIFFHYIIRPAFPPAESETMSLADGIKSKTIMLADYLPANRHHFPFFLLNIFFQKIFHIKFADKAHSLAFFFFRRDQAVLLGNFPNFRLQPIAERKKAML